MPLSHEIRIADAISNSKFHAGNEVILDRGPYKYLRGVFLTLKDDVAWAAIKEGNGAVTSHPVEWMANYPNQKFPD